MVVAICQFDMIWEDKEKNLKKAEAFLKQAKESGADLILFPEMSFTGFSMNIEKIGEREEETAVDMERLSAEYCIASGFGWVRRVGDKAENVYSLISNKGERLADYVKAHPFGYAGEDRYYEKGNRVVTVPFLGKRIGLSICYDLRFPELFQALSKTADCILVPANWPAERAEQWKVLLRARAIENQADVIGINRCGTGQGIFYSGDSCAIDAQGRVIAGYAEGEQLLLIELLEDSKEYREKFPVKRDRRTEWYKEIL